MFGTSERLEVDGGDVLAFFPSPTPKAPPHIETPTPAAIIGRYGEGRRANWPVIIAVLLLHAVLLAAIMQARSQFVRHKQATLAVLNLASPPPPPAAVEPPPEDSKPEIVAPRPVVLVPAPVSKVETAPVPAPKQAFSPAPALIAAPAPAPVNIPTPVATVQATDLSTKMISGKPPRYPIESRRKKEQGTVVLALTLGLDGRVSAMTVAKSSGFARLDDAARDAVRSWRWAPTLREGQPAIVRGRVEIPFVLQG